MSNPYKQLGEYDPFGVANIFGLPFSLAEAFKKLTCGGIDGRLKTAKQDYKEAVYSIERAIKDVSRYQLKNTAKAELITDVMGKYVAVFSYNNLDALIAARYILSFSIIGDLSQLESALICAKAAVEYAAD